MTDVTGELSYVGEVAALASRPWLRRPAESIGQWLMVRVDLEGSSFQHEMEMSYTADACQKLSVEC
jgi:hypothetical protein